MQGEEDRSTRAKEDPEDGSAHAAHMPPVVIRKRDVRRWLAASLAPPLHKSRRSCGDIRMYAAVVFRRGGAHVQQAVTRGLASRKTCGKPLATACQPDVRERESGARGAEFAACLTSPAAVAAASAVRAACGTRVGEVSKLSKLGPLCYMG